MTQREAAKYFNIPRSTIKNKLYRKRMNPVGRSRVFTEIKETALEMHLLKLADFGFPVIQMDFRIIVKHYLDKKGVKIKIFKNNLSVRMSSNIKKSELRLVLMK